MQASIAILMATWNGVAYLSAQLESIAVQQHRDWHLYVRDDGSKDATPSILARFARAHPGQVTLIVDGLGRLGPRDNFSRLMGLAREPYVAFSDQDDIWRPDKLARALGRLRALEAGLAPGTPAMVHADRALIDVIGQQITPSYWASRGLTPADFPRLETYYTFGLAAGATMLINRPLLALARPVPADARMYDCWIELCAQAFGAVAWLDEVALDHRRHGANASGAATNVDSPAARTLFRRAWRLLTNPGRQRVVYRRYFEQAAAFHARHGVVLTVAEARRLDRFLSIPARRFPGRLAALLSARAMPPGLGRGLALVALAGGVMQARTASNPALVLGRQT